MRLQIGSILLALGLGSLGGLLFARLGTPLPYMLGAMVVTITAGLLGLPIAMPRWVRNGIAPVLGVMFGSVLDIAGIPTGWTLFALVTMVLVYLVGTVGLGWLFFRQAGMDPVTSYFASVPGNLSEVVVVAEELGANLRTVVLVHSARIVVTITAISLAMRYGLGLQMVAIAPRSGPSPDVQDVAVLFACGLVGYFLGRFLRIPAPHLFGPLALSVAVHASGLTDSAPPAELIAAAQIVLGVFIGVRFAGVRISEVAWTILLSVAWGLILLALISGYALLASVILKERFPAMVLAFTPGGVAEVSALAIATHFSLGFITTVQIIRMTCMLVIGPIVVRRVFGVRKAPQAKD